MTEGRRLNIVLRHNCKSILLSVPHECKLFLMLFSNLNRKRTHLANQVAVHLVSEALLIDLINTTLSTAATNGPTP